MSGAARLSTGRSFQTTGPA